MLAINNQYRTKKTFQEKEIQELRASVFRGKPKEDERYFRKNIHTWLLADKDKRPAWVNAVRDMVLYINKTGSLKYCYYNDQEARVVIKIDFMQWAEAARDEIYSILKRL